MRRRTALIFALVAVLAVLAGCAATDYQLSYTLYTPTFPGGNYVRVGYDLYNSGNRDLINATLRIAVTAKDGAGASLGTATASTAMTDLSVGESRSSYVDIYFSGIPATVDPGDYYVTDVGWDDSGDGTFF